MQVVARGSVPGRGDPVLGSGYLVGAGLVLTAAHVVQGADRVVVRIVLGRGRDAQAEARIAWIGPEPGVDVAVLRVQAGGEEVGAFSAGLAPVVFGRVEGLVGCGAVGFPLFMLRRDAPGLLAGERLVYRDTHHAVGMVTAFSGRYGGTLEVTVDPPREDPDPSGVSPWAGMSGAAVFAGGVLVGVVCEHHRVEGANRITARRVESWCDPDSAALAALRGLLGLPDRPSGLVVAGSAAAGGGRGGGLPRDTAGFVGREREWAALEASLDFGGGVLAIHAFDGLGGVGKSTFALHAAHRLAGRFPDGQVLVRLHAHTPGVDPVDPFDALAELLLGDKLPPSDLPGTLQGRVRRWRERTAGRRMVLVLDDAVDAGQVEPLLPDAPGTLVLVTARRRIDGLDGVVPLGLGVLDRGEAAALIVVAARRPGLDVRDAQVTRLAGLCGFLPLALSITAARLAAHPGWSVADLAAQLEAAGGRLSALGGAQRSVAAALALSDRDLTGAQRRLLRLLGAHPGTEYESAAAAALLGTEVAEAHGLLAALEEHRLLDESVPGRYRMHDLVREYAADQARQHPEETGPALARLLEHYIAQPRRLGVGGDDAPDERVLPWLRIERKNLLACIEYAYRADRPAEAVRLSHTAAALLYTDGPWTNAVATHERAAQAARESGDSPAHARALTDLGQAQYARSESAGAEEAHTAALKLYRQFGDRSGQANALNDLGLVWLMADEYAAAEQAQTAALKLFRQLGDRSGQAWALNGLGQVLLITGRHAAAEEAHTTALELFRELDNRSGQGWALNDLGRMRLMTGQHAAAEEADNAALDLFRQLGNRSGQGWALNDLGRVHVLTGQHAAAEEAYTAALELFQQLGERSGQGSALNGLGHVRLMADEYVAAEQAHTAALELFRELGGRSNQAYALNGLGRVHALTGQYAAAEEAHTAALELCRQTGEPYGQANALNGLGTVRAMIGQYVAAEEAHTAALELFRQIGDRPSQASALNDLGRVLQATGNAAGARKCFTKARQIWVQPPA